MKVVKLITSLAYGGAQTQLVRLARGLKARGWNVRVVSLLPPQAHIEYLESAGIPVSSLGMRPGRADPRALVQLVRILRSERPLVLCTFLYHANVLGRVAGRLASVPVIVSSIRNENFGGRLRDRVMRFTDWLDDVTIINSHLAARAILQRRVVSRGKLRVIPNGLDVTSFKLGQGVRAQVREEFGLGEDSFLWLTVGRLEEQKDYPNLLAAFARVARERPEAVLWVVGEGPLRQRLEEEVRRLGLRGRIRLLGLRTDIPYLLAAADAFVLASAWEGLPNVIMEAMAAAKPVVATRVGGVPELIIEGQSGFLVPARNAEALAGAMLRLMSLSEGARAAMGQVGRNRVETHYALERVVDQWDALYRELLRRRGVRV